MVLRNSLSGRFLEILGFINKLKRKIMKRNTKHHMPKIMFKRTCFVFCGWPAGIAPRTTKPSKKIEMRISKNPFE